MKLGDTVKVVKGDYKNAVGTVVGITYSFGKAIVAVEPNENADCRSFWAAELKVIETQDHIIAKRNNKR